MQSFETGTPLLYTAATGSRGDIVPVELVTRQVEVALQLATAELTKDIR